MLSEDIKRQLDKGIELIEERNFKEAYDTLFDILKGKVLSNKDKGQIYYYMANIFKNIENTDPLVDELIQKEEQYVTNNKKYSLANARKHLGRKYLKMSAECDYANGLAEYALICINCDPGGGLNYDPNEDNAEVALAWAEKMKKNKDNYVKTVAYIIFTKYYFIKCVTSSDDSDVNNYGDNLLVAENLDKDNEYIKYFLGHLYTNPKFKNYQDGKYSDIKKGYEYFKEVVDYAKDVLIVKSSKKIVDALETKYKKMIEE